MLIKPLTKTSMSLFCYRQLGVKIDCQQRGSICRTFFESPVAWTINVLWLTPVPGNTKGGSITVPLTSCFDWFGISCMTTDNFCFYLPNRLIQTSQTGGQWYSDTSPFNIPCLYYIHVLLEHNWHLYCRQNDDRNWRHNLECHSRV